MSDYPAYPKIPRLNRDISITEKIDGTNARVAVDELGNVRAGSRTRWITPQQDNYGFAKWVEEHAEDLKVLGPGVHYGEWWGKGIQRGYDLEEKRFSLFHGKWRVKPECCHVVPIMGKGNLSTIPYMIEKLRAEGSLAAPGYMNPEGVVVYHSASGQLYKVLLVGDDMPKGSYRVPA